ncbi:6-phosphogluconolactonase [Actinotalea fermentans]|uniref:6-phosphogluconolactonase n=1 Tax=Actinotalea fermentans TaxID=43671 RepID=A0A511YV01_9CELL|nr:6-phosphogluconolactonase [Actinotalea fermentans]KGM17881.1 6-phosphogluconolactonase [Actinotalea fermentans ATCC 43279 = JCM 9966 = DSM 3133]GEN79023.1 6-phosphogluconolactonase [Actinotalea fermentans]
MTAPLVVVHPDAETLAVGTAARLLLRLMDAQSLHRPVHVGLTGGGMGARVLAAVAASPLRDAVDWTGVHVWWGDERFLPAGDPERNETQARAALLDGLALPPENVHAAPPLGPHLTSPHDAAVAYAAELARYAADGDDAGPPVPVFDVLLLGVGPDGHVASLFPGQATLGVVDRTTVGVTDSPKPPPERVSLTLPAIEAAQEVWLVVAGADKAEAVRRALAGADPAEIPAAAVRGRTRTLWLLDVAAAS